MLVLSRMEGEIISLNGIIFFKIMEIRGNSVRIAFHAPKEVIIKRSELCNDEVQDKIKTIFDNRTS